MRGTPHAAVRDRNTETPMRSDDALLNQRRILGQECVLLAGGAARIRCGHTSRSSAASLSVRIRDRTGLTTAGYSI